MSAPRRLNGPTWSLMDHVPKDVAGKARRQAVIIVDLPATSGEHQLRNQEVFYGKRKQTDAGVSA